MLGKDDIAIALTKACKGTQLWRNVSYLFGAAKYKKLSMSSGITDRIKTKKTMGRCF